ncbi:MAG TPA: TonB-dependent receptor [Bryobacteraceae bacterium]|nr:TonB-dependent receptor [Bryobacteraceae bacterium]
MHKICRLVSVLGAALTSVVAQTTTGDILGTVRDSSGAVMTDAKVTVRNIETNITGGTVSATDGSFRVPLLPSGTYELTVEKQGFARYVQRPITLRLNQQAEIDVAMQVAATSETVSVIADAPLINTTSAEVSTNFDTKRIAEVPFSPNRNIINLALNVPGVSQLQQGQSTFASGGNAGTEATAPSFSVNGMRTRSNNFMLDGQDVNDPSVTGLSAGINNQDIVAEFRVITNQFNAEYGRAAGSVVNIITKSGTNAYHGSLFWFHNNNRLNSRNNLDETQGRTNSLFQKAPFRVENMFGGTLGGRVIRDKTFFFGSLLRWTDRRLGSGNTIEGVPTEAGRQVLQSIAGTQPTVRALLENLPPAQSPIDRTAPFTFNGQTGIVQLGSLTGSAAQKFDNWQTMGRIDHRLSERHMLGGRYNYDDGLISGTGQATPAGLTNTVPTRRQAAMAYLNSTFSPTTFNELRLGYNRFAQVTNASNPELAERIPSIEVNTLGLVGFNAAPTRTAIGLAVNLPQFRRNNTYQVTNNMSLIRGSHTIKFGGDLRYTDYVSLFLPTIRGRLVYEDLNTLVNDVIQSAQVNTPLPGGETLFYGRWNDYFFFAQDEWRVNGRLTLSYGLRYESMGDALSRLQQLNNRILQSQNNNPAFAFGTWPGGDHNNWAPRIGLNFRVTEGTVLRGGYARTYDYSFVNIGLNIFSAFPFVISSSPAGGTVGGFAAVENLKRNPIIPANPLLLTRTNITSDFRSPYAEQVSVNVQRQIGKDWAATVGYVGTKGTALFQTIDANPIVPIPGARGTVRQDPTRGVIRQRGNAASSIYHSLQTQLEKRYSSGLVASAAYTWSSFIDNASEVFNAATAGDVAVAQDSYNRAADRGRSSYDRPHRLTLQTVWEVPFLREQKGALGKVLGGWQVNGFLTLQSGAPFTPLAGIDPGGRLSGIDGLVGNSIRPNVATDLDLASMNVTEMRAYNRNAAVNGSVTSLFENVTLQNPLGNAGRNILRADGIGNLDFGLIKNTAITETHRIQLRAEFYNVTNTRNFGIPESRINSANFLNQWGTEGGNRRIQLGLRYAF